MNITFWTKPPVLVVLGKIGHLSFSREVMKVIFTWSAPIEVLAIPRLVNAFALLVTLVNLAVVLLARTIAPGMVLAKP
jgi:hypothetical protein